MSARADLTAEYVRSILDYNPETGEFRWKERPREHFATSGAYGTWNARYALRIAGCDHCKKGYRVIVINHHRHLSHRLAFLWVTGEWPKEDIDHIDGDPSNNRFANLREATRSENLRNTGKRPNNTSGHKGVSWHVRRQKWRVQINAGGSPRHIGMFDNIEDAAAAYAKAARELHGEFARVA